MLGSSVANTVGSNPLWPSGISSGDVERLVEQVLADPNFNIASIPDSLEASIYRSVIRLVFNAVYQSLGHLQGKELMGHQFKVFRWRQESQQSISDTYQTLVDSQDLNDEVLVATCYRLLSNKAINQRLIPDVIERQLYLNCLKLVFRLFAMIVASLKITICGHAVQLDISRAAVLEPAVQRAAISLSAISQARVQELAEQAGYQLDVEREKQRQPYDLSKEAGWWQRWMERRRQAFLLRLHASLWGLILGIIDDLLAHTRIELLSDRVTVDIVPVYSSTAKATIQHSVLPALTKSIVSFTMLAILII